MLLFSLQKKNHNQRSVNLLSSEVAMTLCVTPCMELKREERKDPTVAEACSPDEELEEAAEAPDPDCAKSAPEASLEKLN